MLYINPKGIYIHAVVDTAFASNSPASSSLPVGPVSLTVSSYFGILMEIVCEVCFT